VERIPVFEPCIGADTAKHVTDALDVGWLGMGASTQEFEQRIADYLGLNGRYVAATNTGTSALHIALRTAGVGPGHEVITPSFNYVADHQAIRMTGAEVVMCDVCEENLGMDADKAAELVNEKTRAIVPLHFAGLPCDMKAVNELARKHDLRVIEDGMHAFGTKIDGKKIGSNGDICCFSFDPVKIVTSIDGGCVVVNGKDELETLHHLRLLGVDRDTTERYKNRRAWEYDVVSEGYRSHLNNIMASIGISQIKRVDEFIASRQQVCKAYNDAFAGIEELTIPQTDFEEVSPFIYSARVRHDRREGLIAHLQEQLIDTGIHFIPVHKHRYFSDAPHGDLSVTNKVVREVLTLPLHSNMRPESVERVINGVTSYFSSR
jgi:dTDP-4-amino-4,6-dideoxygalactose transaminase